MKTVFEPFTRANDSRVTKVEGTGLGMSIVRSVVNLMNGTIDVKSKLGEGTTFTVTVYMKLRDGDDQDLTPLEGLRVLVADDEEAAAGKRLRGAEVHRHGARLRVVGRGRR